MHGPVLRRGAAAVAAVASFGLAAFAPAVTVISAPGCIELAAPPARDALDVKDVKPPEGVGLETACTPTGVEICFDARDNNCNGVIDEGCGVHAGILQFAIAWDAVEPDVNLVVSYREPDAKPEQADELIELGNVGPRSGLLKDRECPSSNNECQGQNMENVFLAEGDPKPGRYHVEIELAQLNGASAPVRVRFGARVGQRSFGMSLDLSPGAGTEKKAFEFTL